MSWASAQDPECLPASKQSSVELVIESRVHDLGDLNVRRCLPSRLRRAVGPFVFFDEMGPARFRPGGGMDVRPHPHINLATITYLFEGQILHRDSLGTEQIIEPGAVNLMVAGHGIVHSERTPLEARPQGAALHGLQLWMALPEDHEEMAPKFEHHPAESVPEWTEGGMTVRLLMGSVSPQRSPVSVFSKTVYAIYESSGPAEVDLPKASERGIYAVEGSVAVDDVPIPRGSMAVLVPECSARVRTEGPARFALVGGDTVGRRHMFWNFVSSRVERIEQAKSDWKEHRFSVVPGDETERIPLPE